MKTLGIVGGMSPETTIIYYKKINQLLKERLSKNNSVKIIIKTVNYAEVLRLRVEKKWLELAKLLAYQVNDLAKAGADFAILTPNIVIYDTSIVQTKTDIPVFCSINPVVNYLKNNDYKKVAVIGDNSLTSSVFNKKLAENNIKLIKLNSQEKEFIHKRIYDEIYKNIINLKTRKKYTQIINRLSGDENAQAIVLGNVGIESIIDYNKIKIPVINAATIYANSVVETIIN